MMKNDQIVKVEHLTSALGVEYTKTTTRNTQRKDIEFALKEYIVVVQVASNFNPGYEISEYHTFNRRTAAEIMLDAINNVLTIHAEVRDLFGNAIRIVPKLNFGLREAVLTAQRDEIEAHESNLTKDGKRRFYGEGKVGPTGEKKEDLRVDTVGDLRGGGNRPFHHRVVKVWNEDYAAAEYRCKRDKVIRELSRHGHPEPVKFTAGGRDYIVTLCPQIFGNHRAFKITTANGELKEVK